MAMKLKTNSQLGTLKRRVRQYYDLLNRREFVRCYQMIDPRVREKSSSVTLLQFENSLCDFLAAIGSVDVDQIELVLHLGEPNQLYANRDFAVGATLWTDQAGVAHKFAERWVRDGRSWYTRTTGLIAPQIGTNADNRS
jgi:hypothetical protein